ncbi:Vacuolar protein sorting-associated protein 68 [Fusarium solani]
MREPRHCQPPVPSIANEASSAEHDLHPESTCESSRPLREPAPINPDPRDQHLAVNMEEERLWKFRKPEWLNSVWARNAGVYAAGAIFSVAFYVMLDSAVWSKSPKNGSDVHVKFVDWLPFIFSSLGMLIINSVEKQRLSADSFSYSGSGVAWKARVVLFLGFAALAGGMAGGVTVFVLKFVVPSVAMPALGMGIENVVSNALVGVSSVVLWVSQNMEDEYSYNLSL